MRNDVNAASLASKIQILSASSGLQYTIGSTSDSNTTIGLSSAAANTVYIPATLDTPGYEVNIIQLGTGTTTIVPKPGAIVRQPYNQFKLAQPYSAASLVYMNSVIGWVLYGDLKS